MPRPDPFTPRRRLVMKIIIWVVFIGTIGLAQLVVWKQDRSQRVELASAPVETQGVLVKLPAKWKARQSEDASVIAAAAESRSRGGARAITVYCEKLDTQMSALEYLARRFDVVAPDEPENLEEGEVEITRATQFGAFPGVMSMKFAVVPGNVEDAVYRQTYAAAVLPSGRAVAIKLEGRGSLDQRDPKLVDQVARAMEIRDEPPLAGGDESITLAGGVELKAPPGFQLVLDRDRSRTSRRLWYDAKDRPHAQWASVELFPCMLPSSELLDREQTDVETELRTMLVLHSPRWRDAKVKTLDEGVYQIDPASEVQGETYPSRAYFKTSNGLALLAIERASPGDLGTYWDQLNKSIRFNGSAKVAEMVQAGAAEMSRLRELPLDQLLKDREDEWYLWVNGSAAPQVGWSHIEWTQGQIAGEVEARRRTSDGTIRYNTKWSAFPDWNRFRSDLSRMQTSRRQTAKHITQRVEVRGDSVSLTATLNNKELAQWKRIAPPNYVSGDVLEQIIGKLSPTNMILKTESFAGYGGSGAEGLLTLIVRNDAESATTRSGRGVSVEVNGTGEVWCYRFKTDGALESIELPGGVKVVESKEDDVKRQFTNDSEMRP